MAYRGDVSLYHKRIQTRSYTGERGIDGKDRRNTPPGRAQHTQAHLGEMICPSQGLLLMRNTKKSSSVKEEGLTMVHGGWVRATRMVPIRAYFVQESSHPTERISSIRWLPSN